jgi:hypothetical protein
VFFSVLTIDFYAFVIIFVAYLFIGTAFIGFILDLVNEMQNTFSK